MDRPIVFIRNFLLIISFIFLVWGCEQKEQSPPKPRGVTKKIVIAEKEKSKPVPSKGTDRPVPKVTPQIPETSVDSANQKKISPVVSKPSLIEKPKMSDLYNPEGRLDPFEPLFKKEHLSVAVTKKKPKRRSPLTPLEKIDLSQLKLVGIILASSGNRALIQETSGKGYIVKKGTYIGIYSGKIIEILKDEIIVEEETEDIFGKVSMVKKSLKLQKPPGE